jgi:hypothetical protein
VEGHLYSITGYVTFLNTSAVNGACSSEVVCYAKDTLLLTKQGFVPIQYIKPGQTVETKGKIFDGQVNRDARVESKQVVWVSKFKVFDMNEKTRPICVQKHAFGKNVPFQDLYVSPNHSLLVNGRMVLAKNMVNGRTIYQDKQCASVEYYHVECEHHCTVVANGLISESYNEKNNREIFETSNPIRSKPDFSLHYARYSDGRPKAIQKQFGFRLTPK